MKDTILSVDIGTSFVKAGLYTDQGECLCTHKEKTVQVYKDGALVQEADDYIATFLSVVTFISQTVSDVKVRAIAFTGQMAGAVGVDEDMNAVTDWSGTVDSRQDLSMFNEEDIRNVAAISGTNTPIFAKKVNWFEAQLGGSTKVSKYIGIVSFVIAKITGTKAQDAVMQSTNMAFTGLSDTPNATWSKELCERFDINMDLLPRIAPATSIAGYLSSTFADLCGLEKGIPIVTGAGDKIASCIGNGLIRPGMAADESSTVGAITVCVDSYKPNIEDKSLEVIPGAIEGQYYMMFYIAGSGVVVDWFIQNFACEQSQFANESGIDVHTLLEKSASQIPAGSENLICISLLGGRSLPFTPSIRGMWIGHSFSHTKAHFYRSLLESIAYEYKRSVDVMRKEFPHLSIDEIYVLGGGSKSPLWNGIKASVMQANYLTIDRSDVTLLGTSIIGAAAIGMLGSIEEGVKLAPKVTARFYPDRNDSEIYLEQYRLYTQVLNANMDVFEKLRERRQK